MQITVFPTVFVALGGTGQSILHQFRKGLRQRIGTADLPFFRYLYIDTDVSSLQDADAGLSSLAKQWTKTNLIDPSPDTIKRIRNPQEDGRKLYDALGLEDWFPPYVNDQLGQTNYSQGVGGRRVLSRLGFLSSRNLGELEQILSQFYDELHGLGKKLSGKRLEGIEPEYLDIRPQSVADKVRFVVITSAGGGTGSGSFIDFGFFLRRLAERKSISDKQIDLIGHVLLARVAANPNQVRNSAAILTELDLYQVKEGRVYHGHYLNLPGSPWVNSAGHKPYDCTYMLMPQQQLKVLSGSDPFLTLQTKIADYLLCDTVAAFADNIASEQVKSPRFGPVGVEAFKGDFKLNVAGLQTYGISRREWPAALIHKQLYSQKLRSLSEQWSEVQEGALTELMSKLRKLSGLPSDPTKKPPRRYQEDAIFSQLCQAVDQNTPARLVENVRLKVVDDKKKAIRKGGLTEMVGELRSLFAEQRSDDPRSVIGVITSNRKRLAELKGEGGLSQQVAAAMLEQLFTTTGGPATVARASRQLREEVKSERRLLEESLGAVNPRLPDQPESLKQGFQYANDMLLRLVLESKKSLLAELEAWVTKLEGRFQHLVTYVLAWKESVAYNDSDLKGSSVVVPKAFLDKFAAQLSSDIDLERLTSSGEGADLKGRLTSLIQQGLPETDKMGEPTLFAKDVPRKRGAPDFAYFQTIESFVFQEIERLPSGPYQQEVFTAMVEAAKEEGGNPVANLMEEAEFLIHADTGAHDYTASYFGGHPTHISLIYQVDQKDTVMFESTRKDGERWLSAWSSLGLTKSINVCDQVTNGLTRHAACVITERCALPSEFIVGYDLERRREWFDKDPFPAVTDKRIAIPPSASAQARAEKLLVASMTFDMWRYEGGKGRLHRLDYRSSKADGAAEDQQFQVSSSYHDAIETLARRTDVMNALERKLRDYLGDNEGQAVEKLVSVLETLHKKNPERGTTRGVLADLNLQNVPYTQFQETVYLLAREFDIRLPRGQHPYAEFVAHGDATTATGKSAAHDGWFCKKCGYRQGSEEPEWVGPEAHCQNEECKYPHQSMSIGARV